MGGQAAPPTHGTSRLLVRVFSGFCPSPSNIYPTTLGNKQRFPTQPAQSDPHTLL
jgi:hypothetical protein